MIELNLTTAIVLYLGLTLTCILCIWGYSHYWSRKKVLLSQERQLYLCEYCQHVYLEEGIKNVNRCPLCGSFNKENHYS